VKPKPSVTHGLYCPTTSTAAENRKHPHRAGDEAAFERLRRKVQSLASAERAFVSKRYKSILCQADPYLLELVRYIHLNPLPPSRWQRSSNWIGTDTAAHSALVGNRPNEWQAVDAVLRLFGEAAHHGAAA